MLGEREEGNENETQISNFDEFFFESNLEEEKEELVIFNKNYENFILNPPEVITKGRKPESRLRSVLEKRTNSKFKHNSNASQVPNLKRQALGSIKLVNPLKKTRFSY